MQPAHLPFAHPANTTPAIWHPEVDREGWGLVLFRRRFALAKAGKPVIWVSASERYELWVDGALISRGPTRSDPDRWFCREVRLPRLDAGKHVIAVRVWHAGSRAGIGQMGNAAFLLIAAGNALAADLTTAQPWRCTSDESRLPTNAHVWQRRPYYPVGCGEIIDGAEVPWGWEQARFAERDWVPAKVVCKMAADRWGNTPLRHRLRADPLPEMEHKPARFKRVGQAPDKLMAGATKLIRDDKNLRIAAGTTCRIVVDAGELVNCYPLLTTSGGAGARIDLIGAEAPYTGDGHAKAHRDQVEDVIWWGHRDSWRPAGGKNRQWRPLWFRCFRYLVFDIQTADEDLVLNELTTLRTAYPLKQVVKPTLSKDWKALWDVSWRTIRACAHETFFDCPHYEQAQFPGDTRVQAIYHYLVADDDRLARKAIDDFHASRVTDGMLQCRYPSRQIQILPTFALYWIGMLEDFRAYRDDPDWLRPFMPAARDVIAWFERLRRDDGLLGQVPHAPFTDWAPGFDAGNAPQDADGGSAILTLLFAQACQWLADLEESSGMAELAPRWQRLSSELKRTVKKLCWDSDRKLLADTVGRASYSQHAQIIGVLAGLWPEKQSRKILKRAEAADDLIAPGSFYFKYYQWRAWQRVGGLPDIDGFIAPWHECLERTGLTTWPETMSATPRSDCHAWSITPALILLEDMADS